MARLGLIGIALLLAACGGKPQETPLPTRDKTIGRVEDPLKKAEEEAARRREQIDAATSK